jgi:DNA-binding transcriptional LysR family regulator
MTVDLEHLTSLALFARVVQLHSFTAAAEQSGLAKSAVSKRITQLEKHLGVQLLRRTTRKLALTEEGLRFYEHCAKVLQAAERAQESVAAANTAMRGPLRVSGPVTFSQMHLAPAIAEFLKLHPEIELTLSLDDRLVDVVEGGFDVVIRISRLKDASFVVRKLATDRLVVCASPEYLDRMGRPSSPEELVRHNCLHYGLVPLSGEWRFRGQEGPMAIPVRSNFTATDGTVLRQVALAGLGLAVLPSFMVAPDVAAGRLELVLEGHRRAEIGLYAVTAQGRQLPMRTRAFVEFLVRRFANVRWEGAKKSARS